MLIKYLELYLIYVYYFGINLTPKFKQIFAEFFMNILNGISVEESYNKMIFTCENTYHQHIFRQFSFDKDKITNVNIKCNINKDILTYEIEFNLNNNKMKYEINNILSNKIIKLINKSSRETFYKLMLYYIILDYERILFIGPDPQLYNYFDKNYKVVECFASIFNHTCKNFYSLLDIEMEYGSKGNFFDKFLKDEYKMYLINPPYTEKILLNVFELIIQKLKIVKQEIIIIMYLPNWTDIFHKLLPNLKYYKKYKLKSHQVFNHYTEELNCRYLNTVIIITSNKKINFSEIINKINSIIECTNVEKNARSVVNKCIHL